jgi:hypothetical protein
MWQPLVLKTHSARCQRVNVFGMHSNVLPRTVTCVLTRALYAMSVELIIKSI